MTSVAPTIQLLGQVPYELIWQRMRDFTDQRDEATPDEFWFLQHPPIFTQGLAGLASHLLAPGDIPVIKVDRGGQVTYHGPGQWVVYTLLDLRRLGVGIRELVSALERSIIHTLADYGVAANARREAPGVYVNHAKIASVGLRVRRGCCFHGIALNVDMDLAPFQRINPCGYPGLAITQLTDLVGSVDMEDVRHHLQSALFAELY